VAAIVRRAFWFPLIIGFMAPIRAFAGASPPVILITIDTLRADRVGCYGDEKASTPTLDQLAREGEIFDRLYAPAPLTLPSHASLMTGLQPSRHGIRDNGGFQLDPAVTTLAQRFHAGGYATGAFVSGMPLKRGSGIERGFDVYDDRLDPGREGLERSAPDTIGRALSWLKTIRQAAEQRPFFLWVHLYEPHSPYRPPEAFAETWKNDLYRGEIAFVDSQVGLFFETLRKQGIYDRAVVAVVGDHGEGLGDHGEARHGVLLYEETVRAPAILKASMLPRDLRGVVDRTPLSMADFSSSLLSLSGLSVPEGLDGRIRPLPGRSTGDGPIPIESAFPALHFGWSPLFGVVDGKWKLISGPDPELYDLIADPHERHNLVKLEERVYRRLSAWLASYQKSVPANGWKSRRSDLAVDPRLRSLGYLTGSEGSPVDYQKDPKAWIEIVNRREEGEEALANGDGMKAMKDFTLLMECDPDNYEALMAYARSCELEGFDSIAILSYERANFLRPTVLRVYDSLFTLRFGRGEYDQAEEKLKTALLLAPGHPKVLSTAADFYHRMGRGAEELSTLESLIEIQPNDQNVRERFENAVAWESKRFRGR